jgi:hypothetical protein
MKISINNFILFDLNNLINFLNLLFEISTFFKTLILFMFEGFSNFDIINFRKIFEISDSPFNIFFEIITLQIIEI